MIFSFVFRRPLSASWSLNKRKFRLVENGLYLEQNVNSNGVFFWYLRQILFFWFCPPKTVGLDGLPDLLLRELEDFADFAKTLVLMRFLVATWLESLPGEPRFQVGAYETLRKWQAPILLGMENFVCKVYWFQNSIVV